MNDENLIGGMTAVVLSDTVAFISPMKWFFFLGIILVLADLRFGIEASRARKEDIRFSRAIRRTINKMIDYLCWIFVAGAIGMTFGVPFDVSLLPVLVMLVVYGIEINSCFSNYFESKGKKVRVNIFKFFSKKTDIIEVEEEEENNG